MSGAEVVPSWLPAAYAAYQRAWLTHNQDNPLFAEKVVREVVEAAAPDLRAEAASAERGRLRAILRANPVMLADPVAIAKLLQEQP